MAFVGVSAESRILAFSDTIQACTQNKPLDKKIDYNIPSKGVTTEHNITESFQIPITFGPISPIHVLKQDCIVASSLVSRYGKICVLNMANPNVHGGGVRSGDKAQEEDLCRRSNLYPSLTDTKYPIASTRILYTKGVLFFKAPDYKYMPIPLPCDVVSVASFRLPSQRSLTESERYTLLSKIRLMFLLMYKNGIKVPIVSGM
jgi:uncharacterized protein (TIGR02452 family)